MTREVLSMMRSSPLHSLFIAAGVALVAPAAWAGPEEDVKGLLEKGSAAYDELDFDAARTSLEKALVIAARNQGKVSGPLLAKVHLRLGVIYIAIDKDKAKAEKAFSSALKADPKADVDPSLSTPEIDSVFASAKKAAGLETAPPVVTPPTPVAPVLLTHKPPREASTGTPLRIRIEVPEGVKASKVTAYYRTSGQTRFTALPLEELAASTYQTNIPGNKIKGSSLEYYVAAENDDAKVVGLSGSSDAPHLVQITATEVDPGGATPATGKGGKGGKGNKVDPGDGNGGGGEEPTDKGDGKRSFSFVLTAGTAAGLVTGFTDLSGDKINGAGLSFPEVILSPELAFYASPSVTVGAIGRVQLTGNQGSLEGASTAPSAGGALRVRYFYGEPKSFRPFFAGEGGFALLTQRFVLTQTNGDKAADSDHEQGPFLGLGWGFESDLSSAVALAVNTTLRGYYDLTDSLPAAQLEISLGFRFGN